MRLVDVTAGGGPAVPPQQRRIRRKASSRDAGPGLRLPRLRRRRLAGHPARQRHGLARAQAPAFDAAAVSQQPQRDILGCHAQRRPRRGAVRDGRRRRRLEQRRVSGSLGHVRRPEPAVPEHRQGNVRRRHARERPWRARRPSARRRCGSTSIATDCSICSSATTSGGRSSTTCSAASTASRKSYCTPEAYRGDTCWLFRNRGNGTFEDVTATSGIFDTSSKSLGVAMLDDDSDGWLDLFVANDTQPNKLYRNMRNGTFKEIARRSGRRVQRGRQGARGDGRRCRQTSTIPRQAEPGGHEFRQRDDRALSGAAAPGVVSRTSRCGPVLVPPSRNTLGIRMCVRRHRSRRQPSISSSPTVTSTRPCGISAATSATPSRRSCSSTRATARFASRRPLPANGFAAPKVGRGLAYGDFDRDGDRRSADDHQWRPGVPVSQRSTRGQPLRCGCG